MLLKIILLISLLINSTLSARILIHCPTPSFSHQVIYQPIIKELSLRGHQVISITTDPINDPTLVNLTEISVRFSYEVFKSRYSFDDRKKIGSGQINLIKDLVHPIVWEIYDPQLSHPEVKKLIENPNEHFDLVIVEWVSSAFVAYSERFNCPMVGIISMGLSLASHVAIGNSVNPSYYADLFLPFSEPTTFFERIKSSLYNIWFLNFMHTVFYPEQNKLIKKHFGENATSIEELQKRVSFVFTNSHPVIYGARPTVPSVINIAGIYKKQRKSLSEDLQAFLDNATEGVIYFSLGSNFNSNFIPKETLNIFTETFKSLPYKVLWKFESEELPGKPDNVKISKWFPQSDVLFHPNVKLFITQGGIQSWEEAIHGNVPLIGFPINVDQFWNVDRMQKLGIGIKMDIDMVDQHSLTQAIQKVMNNSTYYEKIKNISDLFNDQPMKPLDKAVYWIEYVIRHGRITVFHSPTMNIPWYQYFLVDVVLFLVICFVSIILVIYFLIKTSFKLFVIKRISKKKIN